MSVVGGMKIRIQSPNRVLWPYPTPGHFLNISGIYNDGSHLLAIDPYITHEFQGHSGHFWHPSNRVYDVMTIRTWGQNIAW
ncbi:MAG: hypothetical protein FWC91_10440 [Defluviitaleaceae bacterium]|nr:hypothetical protein [Defluviitaleaceae bacterium]